MAEYIDREKATEIIKEKQKELCPVGRYGRNYVYGSDREKYDVWEDIIDAVRNIPAVDVAPVVHGEWVDTPDGTATICSYCKADWNVFDNDTYRFNYCPNCGAKMDREDEEDGTVI